jgi:SAM-dependent methyltransferase/quercetin dioxygenase-like cupin family protein
MHTTKIAPVWTDGRGRIADILNGVSIRHIGIITSKAGSVRGNHYHRKADQYDYLLQGRLEYYEQEPGRDVTFTQMVAGDLVLSRAGAAHALRFLEDSILLVFSTESRANGDFQEDTVRLEHPLVEAGQQAPEPEAGTALPVYGERSAAYYDAFYGDKPYAAECDFLEAAFARFADRAPRAVLDIGCGTGGHLVPLAQRGYRMTGVDASRAMVRLAQEKAARADVVAEVRCGRIRDLQLPRLFDAAISMFGVIGYETDDRQLGDTFRAVRSCLRDGALFVFDYRNGIPCITHFAPHRVLDIERDGTRIIRLSRNAVDADAHLLRSRHECLILRGNSIADRFTEEHVARFFFPREIRRMVEEGGFRVLHTCAFPDLDRRVNAAEDYYVGVVAQAAAPA